MAYIKSPNLCEPCKSIINSPGFREAIEILTFFETFGNEGSPDFGSPSYSQCLTRAIRTKDDEPSAFKLYGDLLSSRHSCALCGLILECRTSVWGDWRLMTLDYKPNLEDTTSLDTELVYGIDSASASLKSCVALSIGTEKAKLALVHISLVVSTHLPPLTSGYC